MFVLGSVLHAAIIFTIAIAGLLIGIGIRRRALSTSAIPLLGALITLSEAIWYVYLLSGPWPVWPGMLPLHLCDITLWLTVASALVRSERAFGTAYYWGLAGTSMALLTPDVQGSSWSYPTIQFFVSHGLVITTLLAMAVSNTPALERQSWWSAFLRLQVVAAVVAAFNVAFGTNYLYLTSKPGGSTLFDLLGPWPWYLLSADLIGAGLFFALSRLIKRERPAVT